MADKTIQLDILFNTADAATNVRDLKTALKDLKSAALSVDEGSEAFDKITQKAGQLNDKITRVNDNIRANTGNAVENATRGLTNLASVGAGAFSAIQGAATLFGNESKDLQKTLVKLNAAVALTSGLKSLADAPDIIRDSVASFKALTTVILNNSIVTKLAAQAQIFFGLATEGVTVAMKALRIAIAATGIGAIALAIYELIVNAKEVVGVFDKFYDKLGFLGNVAKWLNPIYLIVKGIDAIKVAINGASDATGDFEARVKALNEALDKGVKTEKLRREATLISIQSQIDLAKAQGKSAQDISKLEDNLFSAKLKNLNDEIAVRKTLGADSKDQADIILGLENDKLKLIADNTLRVVSYYETLKKEEGKYTETVSKEAENRKKISLDESKFYLEKLRLRRLEYETISNGIIGFEQGITKTVNDETAKRQELYKKQLDSQVDAEKKSINEVSDIKEQAIKKGFEIAQASTNALGSLSELLAQQETQNLKKGEKLSIAVQKKQFARQKALGLVNTAINGAEAIVGSFKTDPSGILATIIGITTAVNIAAIAAKKFNPDAPTNDTSNNIGGGGNGNLATPSTPIPSTPNQFALYGTGGTSNQAGAVDNTGVGAQRVYVLESDITNTQNRVVSLRAEIG